MNKLGKNGRSSLLKTEKNADGITRNKLKFVAVCYTNVISIGRL